MAYTINESNVSCYLLLSKRTHILDIWQNVWQKGGAQVEHEANDEGEEEETKARRRRRRRGRGKGFMLKVWFSVRGVRGRSVQVVNGLIQAIPVLPVPKSCFMPW